MGERIKVDKGVSQMHILSLSYGKDSLACLGAIEELKLPLNRIVHVEVWATDTIPADLPQMVEFKAKADKIIKERYGITVEHISSKPYEHYFYKVCNGVAYYDDKQVISIVCEKWYAERGYLLVEIKENSNESI
jgi:hypothetical protein